MIALLAAAAHADDLVDKRATIAALEPAAVLEAGLGSVDVAVRRDAMHALLAHAAEPCTSPWVARGRYDPSEYVQREVLHVLDRRCPDVAWAWAIDTDLDASTRALAARLSGVTDPAKLGEQALALRSDGRAALYLLVAANAGNTEAAARLAELARAGNLPIERELYATLAESPTFPFADAFAAAEPEVRPWLAAAWFQADPKHGRGAAARMVHSADLDVRFDVVEALRDDPDATSLLKGAPGLDAKLATGLFPTLARQHAADHDLDRRLDALATLGRSTTPKDRALLRTYAADADLDEPVRVAVARALATHPEPADLDALRTLLTDESLEVRVVAAAALG